MRIFVLMPLLLCSCDLFDAAAPETKPTPQSPPAAASTCPPFAPLPERSGDDALKLLCGEWTAVAYSAQHHIPRAVAEELRPEHLQGPAERRDDFFPDPRLGDNDNAALQDYRGSGFDRGHLAPAADFKYNFDLRTNQLQAGRIPNPRAGTEHRFVAYRLNGESNKPVSMVMRPIQSLETSVPDENDSDS